MNCLSCRFFDFNDYLHGYGMCEPQSKEHPADHVCDLSGREIAKLENLTGHKRQKLLLNENHTAQRHLDSFAAALLIITHDPF